jgi:hypothetical protein
MLDLVFANFTDLKSVPADSGLVAPDKYHPPLNIDVSLPNVNNNLIMSSVIEFSHQATTLCFTTFTTSSVDVAVASLNAALRRYYIAEKIISTVVLKRYLPITFTTGSPITENSSKIPSSPTGLDG